MKVENPVRVLPIWKAWLEENADRIKFGATFTSEELVKFFGEPEDSLKFAMAIHDLRKALRRRGMNFTARGQFGKGYCIPQPNTNADEIQRMQRAAISAMREAHILGTSTPTNLLTDEERRLHDACVERIANRLVLMTRKDQPRIGKAQ